MVVKGGTLALLFLARPWSHKHPQVEALEYALMAGLPVSDSMSIVETTTHFPPGLSALERCLTSCASLRTTPSVPRAYTSFADT